MVGRTIELDGSKVHVVGVMPASFQYPGEKTDLWQAWGWAQENRARVSFRRAHYLTVVARLKPGVTEVSANNQFQAVVKRLQTDYPATNKLMGAGMTPLHEFLVGDTRTPLLVLLGAVALLLLIACAQEPHAFRPSRILYVPAYLAGVFGIRSAIWVGSWVGLVKIHSSAASFPALNNGQSGSIR